MSKFFKALEQAERDRTLREQGPVHVLGGVPPGAAHVGRVPVVP